MSASSTPPRPSPAPYYTLRPHAGDVTSVEYLNIGGTGGIVSGTSDGQLSVWSLTDKRRVWSHVCPASITSVSRIGSTDNLSVQLKEGVVGQWSLETGKPGSSLSINNPSFCRLSHFTSPDNDLAEGPGDEFGGKCFAVADSNYGRVNLYNWRTERLIFTLSAENVKSRGMCMCIKAWCDISTGCPFVLAGFDDGSILLWDARQPTSELSSIKLFPEPVMCMAVDGEATRGVCGSPGTSLETFSISIQEGLMERRYNVEFKNSGVSDVAVRHDNKIMASGGWDGRIRVFGWKKGKPLAILNYHSAVVHCVTFSEEGARPDDSNLMICGSKDSRISLWRLY